MDKEKVKEIASKGGEATAGKNLSEEDRRKGGEHSHSNQNE